MRLPRLRHVLLIGAILGLIVPSAILVSTYWRPIIFPPQWMLVVWPSLIMFMGIDDHGYSLAPLSLAVITNILIYAFVAESMWCVAWVIRGWRHSLRDGTTI